MVWESQTSESQFWFQFWYLVLAILLLIQLFGKANFNLYCQSLTEPIPYLFAKNNVNYAQFIYFCPQQRQYDLTETTSDGSGALKCNVIVHKSSRKLSPIIIDQALEYLVCVKILPKMDGTGPEVTCLITQLETGTEHTMQPSWAPNHQGAQGHLKNMPHLMFSPQYRHTLPRTIRRSFCSIYTGQIVWKMKPSQLKRGR